MRQATRLDLSLAPVLFAALLGCALGALVLIVADMETRWIVYTASAVLMATIIIAVPNQQRFLWGLLVLSLQINVSIRFMYGYAGSTGLAAQLPFLAALTLLLYYAFSGRLLGIGRIRWGGVFGAPIGVMLVVATASAAMSSNQFVGFTAIFNEVQLYVVFWVVINTVRTEAQFKTTLKLLLVCLVIQSIVYFIQAALGVGFTLTGETRAMEGLPRPGGTVATAPHGFGSFILAPLFVAISSLLAGRHVGESPRRLTMVAAVLGLVALVLTLTRAAWGAFGLGFLCVTYLTYRRGVLSVRKVAGLGFALLVVSAIATPLIAARLDGAPLEKSYNERAALMQMAIQVIKSHPVLGVGPGAYPMTYKRYLTTELAGKWQSTVHNHYLLRIAENGMVGGVAFIALLVVGFIESIRLTRSVNPLFRDFGFAASATIVATAFDLYWDMWTFFTTQSMLWVLLGLILVARSMDRQRALGEKSPRTPSQMLWPPLRESSI
jgi:putative inorganic carbon (hco3(-)) transporter